MKFKSIVPPPMLVLMLVLIVQACSHTPVTTVPKKNDSPGFQGVDLALTERAHDGEYAVSPDEPSQQVDANSVLRLTFDAPDTIASLSTGSEWQSLEKALKEIARLTAEYNEITRLAATLPVDRNNQTTQWQQRIAAFDKKIIALEHFFNTPEMQSLLKEDSTTLALRAVDENKSPNELRAEILVAIREALHREAQQFTQDVNEYEVIVRAYLVPEVGDVRGLSIKGYNNLQSRPLKPINRLGIIPTEAEAQRLQAEYLGAQAVKTAVVAIKANSGEVKAHFSGLIKETQQRFAVLSEQIQDFVGQWEHLYSASTSHALTASVQADVVKLVAALNNLKHDVQQIKTLKQDIETLKAQLNNKDIVTLVLDLKENSDQIKRLISEIKDISARIKTWPGQINNIVSQASLAAAALLSAQNTALAQQINALTDSVKQNFTQFESTLSGTLPGAQVALGYLSDDSFISQGKQLLTLSEHFNRSEPGAIPRPLDKLEPAEVDLRRAGLTPGDIVEVDVGFFKKTQYTQPEKRITYTAQTVLTDWHRRFSSDLIFVRSEKGAGSDEYKPNVGVTLEWHHGTRNKSPGFFERLDMGVGIHAANLDQDADETIEMGAGVNFSFLDGLIRFGYGYNLSAEKHPNYYWFGFELFSMLNKKNKF